MWWKFQNAEVGRLIKYWFVFSFCGIILSFMREYALGSRLLNMALILAIPSFGLGSSRVFLQLTTLGYFFPMSLSDVWTWALIPCLIKHSSNLAVGLGYFVWLFQVEKMWSCLAVTAMASRAWKSVHHLFLNFDIKFMIHWLIICNNMNYLSLCELMCLALSAIPRHLSLEFWSRA